MTNFLPQTREKIFYEKCGNTVETGKSLCYDICTIIFEGRLWRMKKVLIILAVILILAATALGFYLTRPIEVFGSTMRASTVILNFDADTIPSFDELVAKIGEFPLAKCADLGDYWIYTEQAEQLHNKYPHIAFRYKLHTLCGVGYPADATEVDLSTASNLDVPTLISDLKAFDKVSVITFGSKWITVPERDALVAAYPGIRFDVIATYDVCGKPIREDCEVLDLTDVTPDETLAEQLSCLKNLKSVDLHGVKMSLEEKLKLKEALPDIEIGTTVKIAGQEYDTTTQTLDLSDRSIDNFEEFHQVLTLFSKLKTIDLHGVEIPRAEMLKLSEALPDVQVGMTITIGDQEYDTATDMLDLNNQKVGNFNEFQQTLNLFYNLKRVEMCGSGVSNENMEILCSDHPNIKFVWRVYMGQWSLRTDDIAFSVLIVNYRHNRLRTKDVQVLKYCPDLQALDLGHQALTDLSWVPEYVPKLRILILADNNISDLTPLGELKHLHYLEFFVNKVTDVSPLGNCKELVDLNISYNPIRDVTALYDLPIIERLWMESTYVPPKQIQTLKESHPDAKVVDVGSGSVDQGWRSHQRYFDMIDMYYSHNYVAESFSKYDGLVFPD